MVSEVRRSTYLTKHSDNMFTQLLWVFSLSNGSCLPSLTRETEGTTSSCAMLYFDIHRRILLVREEISVVKDMTLM